MGIEGGTRDFAVRDTEKVFYWWRGPSPREGIRLEEDELHLRPYRMERLE